jgi:hypothetical protein
VLRSKSTSARKPTAAADIPPTELIRLHFAHGASRSIAASKIDLIDDM